MGRFKKVLKDINGVDKRDIGYYYTPKFIADYLTNEMLNINSFGRKVLDPAVGKEELLDRFLLTEKEVDSFDIFNYKSEYSSNFQQQDFIKYYGELKERYDGGINLDYDYYIANPPYNCHEVDFIKDNKKELQRLFKKVGVHNMYSMFLSAIIDCAKEGALIGVIISDSFLTAKMHAGLRQQILEECSIHQLILCPNDLFWSQKADVRTCILILQKGQSFQNEVKTSNRPINASKLEKKLNERDYIEVSIDKIVLSKKKSANQFIIDIDSEILHLFSKPRIGDVFNCITGISTGNDKKYLSSIKKEGFEVPFYKNPGSKKFKTEPDAYLINHFLDESLVVSDFMVRNKKFVFKEGITCSSMGLPFSACYLPENSTYGVNPNIFTPKEDLYWMLSYLNSSLITYLVRGVLIRSNMVTSGYISQLPVISFSENEKNELEIISKAVLESNLSVDYAIKQIDSIINSSLQLSQSVISKIEDFVQNLNKKV